MKHSSLSTLADAPRAFMSNNEHFDAAKRAAVYFQSDSLRIKIIASYWAVVLCAVPLWWYTTSITRLSLPTARVAALDWVDAVRPSLA